MLSHRSSERSISLSNRWSFASSDPAMTQSGDGAGSGTAQPSGGRSAEPEFGKEPPQVQASADGEVRRETAKDRKDEGRRDEGRKDNSRH